jgi:hypothetical protein
MDDSPGQDHRPYRRRGIVYFIYAISLLLLNLTLLIFGHRDELLHLAEAFSATLTSVNPFNFLMHFLKWWGGFPWNWCFSSTDPRCLEQARQRMQEWDQLWSSMSVAGIVLHGIALAVAGIAWMGWSDTYRAKNSNISPIVGFVVVLVGASAIVWTLRLLLLFLVGIFGWVLGLAFWLNAFVFGTIGVLMHGRELFHNARNISEAFRQIPPNPPPG